MAAVHGRVHGGLLLVLTPAGAGAREAALAAAARLDGYGPVAAVLAVVFRLLFVVGDLAWSALAVVAEHRGRARSRSAR